MLEIATCCRTCMKSSNTLVNLFEPLELEDGRRLEMDKIVMMCTAIQVSADDGLPQNICYDCVQILQICENFSKQAQNAEKQFRELILTQGPAVKNEVFEIKPEGDLTNKFNSEFDVDSDAFVVFDNDDYKVENLEENNHYQCENCKKPFFKEEKLLKHLSKCHRTPLSCLICYKVYRSTTALDKHLAKHAKEHIPAEPALKNNLLQHNTQDEIKTEADDKNNTANDKIFKCSECLNTFRSAQCLAMHRMKYLKGNYVCDICDKKFSAKNLLSRHLKLHNLERPYACTKCKKKYSRQDELEAHVKFKHELRKPHCCSICNKAFAQRCNLVDHERTHTGETPFLCAECGKGFRNSSNLRQHLMRHTGLKPFACKLCPMTFVTKGQMTTHELTHTGVHPYRCEQCGAAFTKRNSLKKHKLIHLDVRQFGCTTCNMRFTTKDRLIRHQRTHTGEKPYKCKYCERAFTQSNDLVKHTRGHVGQDTYQCKICNMRFRLASQLKQHYPIHYDPTANMNVGMNQEVQEPLVVQKQEEHDKVPLEALAPTVEDKPFDGTITITFNSEGLSKDITISIRPEDIGQGF